MRSKNRRSQFAVLTCEELFALKPGDEFRVYWAKDDDRSNVVFDYELFTITEVVDGVAVYTVQGEVWEAVQCRGAGSHSYNTTRGEALFYKAEKL